MRLIHFADSHIGYSRFDQRAMADGVNVIEADVATTFGIAIDRIIALAPDLVVVGGDVMHVPKPKPSAVLAMVSGFAKLARARPDTVVVVAAGNHDLSRSDRAPGILTILQSFGVHVADRESRRFYFPDRDLSVLAVPDAPGLARPAMVPDARARFNVLVLHGEVQGMIPSRQQHGDRGWLEITTDELGVGAWDYAALGHWHQYRQIAPNCYYSGSLDLTSSDVWSELATPKGFIERGLETGVHTFHELPPSRRYLDLPAIDAHGMGADDLLSAIESAAAVDGGLEGAVVRLVVEGVTKEVGRALDQRALKAVKRGALNFQLDLRRTEREAREPIARSYAELRQRSLPDILAERMARRQVPSDVDAGQLAALAQRYLEDAGECATERVIERESSPAIAPAAAGEAAA